MFEAFAASGAFFIIDFGSGSSCIGFRFLVCSGDLSVVERGAHEGGGRAANAVIPNNLVKKSRLFIVLDVINVLG